MIKPNLKWIEFDRDNPPSNLMDSEFAYLILIADYGYKPTEDTVPDYYTDMATAYGSYIDNFWDTDNDWDEGQVLHVVSYCKITEQVRLDESDDVAYLCNKNACGDYKSQTECKHTTEIQYAKNFKEVAPGKYMEIEENCSGETTLANALRKCGYQLDGSGSYGVPHIAEIRNGKWHFEDYEFGDAEEALAVKVTHWMPLPQNPDGDRRGES